MLAAGVLLLWFLAEPDACQPAFEQAKQQFTEQHFKLAAASFTRAIDVCPASERVPLLLALAQSQLVAQQAREALATVSQVLKTDRGTPPPSRCNRTRNICWGATTMRRNR